MRSTCSSPRRPAARNRRPNRELLQLPRKHRAHCSRRTRIPLYDPAGYVSRSKGKPVTEEIELPPGKPVMTSRLINQIIAGKEPEEVFGGISLAAEINQRFKGRLRRQVQHRTVATTLRRLAKAGYLRVVREGRAVHEALYSRGEGWD